MKIHIVKAYQSIDYNIIVALFSKEEDAIKLCEMYKSNWCYDEKTNYYTYDTKELDVLDINKFSLDRALGEDDIVLRYYNNA